VFIFSLGFIGFFLIGGLEADMLIIGLAVLAVLFVDFVQSVLTGTILGVSVATISRERLSSTTTSLLTFLMVQFCFYAVMGLIALLILPIGINNQLVLTLLQLTFVLLCRELLIYAIWSWTALRLDATLEELNSTVKSLS